jgi:hypothetical protein
MNKVPERDVLKALIEATKKLIAPQQREQTKEQKQYGK